ncbi:hypothetical protein F5148DRAFT_1147039 [Russula earlei]|uniref:Uncharacterized protein n=1 Tax=Russula earlei TaxID=71964 RepID=A0ACC0UJF8_9AGAM|nr:hypothetical protein F5148DRAFT_1147039 [Russula earlei]
MVYKPSQNAAVLTRRILIPWKQSDQQSAMGSYSGDFYGKLSKCQRAQLEGPSNLVLFFGVELLAKIKIIRWWMLLLPVPEPSAAMWTVNFVYRNCNGGVIEVLDKGKDGHDDMTRRSTSTRRPSVDKCVRACHFASSVAPSETRRHPVIHSSTETDGLRADFSGDTGPGSFPDRRLERCRGHPSDNLKIDAEGGNTSLNPQVGGALQQLGLVCDEFSNESLVRFNPAFYIGIGITTGDVK